MVEGSISAATAKPATMSFLKVIDCPWVPLKHSGFPRVC
jgi:hypothetical protein